jgi:CubicO group peptidase (beta-lactamase class C family)
LLRSEILEPLGIPDLYLGLPRVEFDRMAKMTVEDEVRANFPRRAAFSDFVNSYDGVRLPISSAMGVSTARSLASLLSMAVLKDANAGYRILQQETLAAASVPTNAAGYRDLRLEYPIRWGLGFILGSTPAIYGTPLRPRRLGHAGGGSNVAWVDPDSAVAVAFLCNRMLGRDESWERCRRVSDAVDAALSGDDRDD